MSHALAAEHLDLEMQLAQDRARQGLLGFTLHTKPDFAPHWHHRAICRAVNYMEARRTPRELLASWGIMGRELERLLTNPHPVTGLYAGLTHPTAIDAPITGLQVHIAPRHGKTELITRRMPAWWMGRNPNAQIIATGYSADIASQGNRDVQRIMDNDEYTALFPETRLNSANVRSVAGSSYLRNSDIFEIVNHRGVYKNAGVGGPVTGRGADLAICDDPIKNREDAGSSIKRGNLWDWWTSTLYTRLERDACRAIINTRWHEADLSGRTMEQARHDPEADQWFCLVFPALLDCDPGPGDPRKPGEALWPDKYTAEKLKRMRASMGSYDFESLYQQRPAPQEGGIVKQAWWQFYDTLPTGLTDWTLSVDLAFKDRQDYCCFQVWAAKGANRYLVDMVMERMDFTDSLRQFKSLCLKWPKTRVCLVEDAANGPALINTLKQSVSGIIPIQAKGSKESRAEAIAPQVESGNVYLPNPSMRPWCQDFLVQWQQFPNGAHDDAVDAATQALKRMYKKPFEGMAGLPISVGDKTHLADAVTVRMHKHSSF